MQLRRGRWLKNTKRGCANRNSLRLKLPKELL